MTSKQTYRIDLVPSLAEGSRDVMYRGGQQFQLGVPKFLELTDAEVEVFENDWRFKVSDPADADESGDVAEGEGVSQGSDTGGEETVDGEIETVADQDVASEEEDDFEDVEVLDLEDLKKLKREELDAQAKELGIEDPESFDNKAEVAQAIVDAR